MTAFTTLPPTAPSKFLARRWLLCDSTWQDLPEPVRTSPWADWRHRAGLVQCTSSADLRARVAELLQAHPRAHITVLAPKATDAEREELRCCAPEDDGAQRTSIVFGEGPALQRLSEPEAECSEWLGRDGRIALPDPQDDMAPELRADWRAMMHGWAQGRLTELLAEVTEDLLADQADDGPPPAGELAALAQQQAAERAQLLYGRGTDDGGVQALGGELPESWSSDQVLNDERYELMALAAAAASASDGPDRVMWLDSLQARLRVRQIGRSGGRSADDNAAIEVAFDTPPRLPAGKRLMQIELHDGEHLQAYAWPPLPLVLHPQPDAPHGPWLLTEQTHPGVLERFEQWSFGDLQLNLEVWTGSMPQ